MKTSPRLKTALLAAVSLTAASAAVAHAAGAPPYEPIAIEHAVQAADHDSDRTGPSVIAKRVGIAAAAVAALAGLARLIGFRRITAAAAATAALAGKAASAGLAVTASAAKTVAKAVASPFRFALMVTGLALFALTGVGFYDLEWEVGLIVGALFAALVILGAGRLRKTLAPARVDSGN